MGDRLRLLGEVDSFVGRYFSQEFVKKNVLHMNEDDIKREAELIKKESDFAAALEEPPEDENGDQEQPQQQPPQQPPQQPQESFQAANTISEEENLEKILKHLSSTRLKLFVDQKVIKVLVDQKVSLVQIEK